MKGQTIFLLSDKSSGSTAFQYELLKHPHISAAEYTPHNDHETLFWLKAAVALKKPQEHFYSSKYPFSAKFALRSLKDILYKNTGKSDFPLDSEEDFNEAWSKIEEKHDHYFFEKSPHHLNHLASTFLILNYVRKNPKAKVIGLVRDPKSVIYSTMDRWYVTPASRQYKWAYTYNNLLMVEKLINPDQYMRVRYEDLISGTSSVFEKVTDFLGLDSCEEVGKGLHLKSKDKWKSDANFEITLDSSTALLASYFGYETSTASGQKVDEKFKINRFKKLVFYIKSNGRKFLKQKL